MDRDNCFGALSDSSFKPGGAHGPTYRVDIYKDWLCADIANRPSSCYETDRDGDNFIPSPISSQRRAGFSALVPLFKPTQ
jgi:hypothetical protein